MWLIETRENAMSNHTEPFTVLQNKAGWYVLNPRGDAVRFVEGDGEEVARAYAAKLNARVAAERPDWFAIACDIVTPPTTINQ